MNARETMQALLDGHTVVHRSRNADRDFRLNPDSDKIETRLHNKKEWYVAETFLNGNCRLYKEYEIPFVGAFHAMLKGYIVSNEYNPDWIWRIQNGKLEAARISGDGQFVPTIASSKSQNSMWKVVE